MRLIGRSALLACLAGVAALGGAMLGAIEPASAQAKPKLRFSAAFTEQDLRAEGYKALAAALKDDFEFEFYWGNTLFKQGAELVAMQRGNLEFCNLAPADISKQIPAWSLMTSAYLFRDSTTSRRPSRATSARISSSWPGISLASRSSRRCTSDRGTSISRPDKPITTPADLAGIKLSMPPGEFWQFLGESLGTNPTPVAYAELYTALQTGAVDGQDNPLVSSRR